MGRKMYRHNSIGVVIPVYNEAKLIGRFIETMPDYVDKIIVVDDKSTDRSAEMVEAYLEQGRKDIVLLKSEKNEGVGGAIVRGYQQFLESGLDIAVVMYVDAQMSPEDMPALLDPVVDDKADYAKGNRLFTGEAWKIIPKGRYIVNSFVSLLAKIASGYWHVADSQFGYTVVNRLAMQQLMLDSIYKRYNMPSDILIHLNVGNFRVQDVPVKPVYNVGEKSGIGAGRDVPRIFYLLFKGFFWRIKEKYVIRNFHPLVFFYLLGIITMPSGFVYGLHLFYLRAVYGPVAATSALFAVFLFITGLQSLFFAMWMDMEDNRAANH